MSLKKEALRIFNVLKIGVEINKEGKKGVICNWVMLHTVRYMYTAIYIYNSRHGIFKNYVSQLRVDIAWILRIMTQYMFFTDSFNCI